MAVRKSTMSGAAPLETGPEASTVAPTFTTGYFPKQVTIPAMTLSERLVEARRRECSVADGRESRSGRLTGQTPAGGTYRCISTPSKTATSGSVRLEATSTWIVHRFSYICRDFASGADSGNNNPRAYRLAHSFEAAEHSASAARHLQQRGIRWKAGLQTTLQETTPKTGITTEICYISHNMPTLTWTTHCINSTRTSTA